MSCLKKKPRGLASFNSWAIGGRQMAKHQNGLLVPQRRVPGPLRARGVWLCGVERFSLIFRWNLVRFIMRYLCHSGLLGGGFKHFLFSPLPGEMIQFD